MLGPCYLLNSTFDTKPQTTYQGFQVTAGYRRKVFETGYAGSIPVALSKGPAQSCRTSVRPDASRSG